MKLRIQARLRAEVSEAEAIVRALSPDNVGIPRGLTLEVSPEEGAVTVHLRGKARIRTFARTWNDLMINLRTATATVSSLKERNL